jgi:hypothetical protein
MSPSVKGRFKGILSKGLIDFEGALVFRGDVKTYKRWKMGAGDRKRDRFLVAGNRD